MMGLNACMGRTPDGENMQLIIKPGVFTLATLFCILLVSLIGCSSLETTGDVSPANTKPALQTTEGNESVIDSSEVDSTKVDSTKVDSTGANLPTNELTSDLLYDLLLAELALQQNDYDLAFEKYYRAAVQTRDSRLVKKATGVTLYSKNDEQTNKSVKLWSELQPDNLDVQQIYASTLLSQKKDQQAIEYLQRVIALSEDYPTGLKRCVAILDTIPERERVEYLFAVLTKTHQNLPIVHLFASKIAIKYADYEAAEKSLNKTLVLKPDYLEARIVKVELLKKQQRDKQAIELLHEIVADEPENVLLRLELARMLVTDKQTKQAFRHIQVLGRNDQLNSEILFAISLLSMEIDETDTARQYLKRLYAHRLYADGAAYFMGQLEFSEKNYPEAEQWFRRVQHGQYVFEATLRLALVQSQQGKLKDAIILLEGFEPANLKQRLEILQIKAEVYVQAEKYKTGYETYTVALNLSPDNHDLRYGRAMLAEKIGRIDLLEEDLLIIIAANPKDNQALNALGYTLAEQTDRYQEAKKYIEQALAVDGEDIATLDSMGWVLHKLGNNEEAVKYLQKAYEKDADPEIAAHYGEVLWLLGETRKAEKVWKKALKEHPKHKILLATTSRYLE
jgi:tetratricopeptide (TPR) repeat protein